MIEGVIYRYKSPSGKYYIGQTMNEKQRRCIFLNLNHRYGGSKIDNARKKYGPESFEYTVLMNVTGDDFDEVSNYLNTLEIGFIKMYDSFKNGYNSTEGGDTSPLKGRTMSDEQKRKISESLKGRPSPNKGKKASEETRRKLSEAHKNESEETRRKKSESHKGKTPNNKGSHLSLEARMSISMKNKGQISPTRGKCRVYSPDGSYHYE